MYNFVFFFFFWYIGECGANHVAPNFNLFLLKMKFFFTFSDCFDVLMSKII